MPAIERVIIDPEAWSRMLLYVDCCETEIGGLGIGVAKGLEFHLEEVILIKQWVTANDVLLANEGLATFLHEFVDAGGDPSKIKVWWHSHVHHPLRWSKQDEETIRLLNQDYLISLVGDKSGSWLCRLDKVGPPATSREPIPMEVSDRGGVPDAVEPALREEIQREIDEKVTVWELVQLPGQGGYFFGTEVVTSDYSIALESYGSFLLPWESGGEESGPSSTPEAET